MLNPGQAHASLTAFQVYVLNGTHGTLFHAMIHHHVPHSINSHIGIPVSLRGRKAQAQRLWSKWIMSSNLFISSDFCAESSGGPKFCRIPSNWGPSMRTGYLDVPILHSGACQISHFWTKPKCIWSWFHRKTPWCLHSTAHIRRIKYLCHPICSMVLAYLWTFTP